MAEGEGKSLASSREALISGGRSSSELKPWIEYAVEQAESFGRTMQETADSAVASARYRLLELHAISSDLLNRSSEVYAYLKAGFVIYENAAFGILKDGLLIAADHPSITLGVAAGSSLLALKRPRRFLLCRASRLFVSEESMISNAEEKVKQLRQSVELVRNESKKLEVSSISSEAKREKGVLSKAVIKISNYGISI